MSVTQNLTLEKIIPNQVQHVHVVVWCWHNEIIIAVTASSFPWHQGTDPMKVVVPEVKNYHHLESNRALPLPLISGPSSSEARNEYIQHLSSKEFSLKHKDSIGNRTSRIKENKGSHFTLGCDAPQNESENVCSQLLCDNLRKGPHLILGSQLAIIIDLQLVNMET